MPTVQDVLTALETIYPPAFAFPDDPIGLQTGSRRVRVRRALVALDPDPDAVDAAKRIKAELIVAHHPIWWKAPRTLSSDQAVGLGAVRAIESGIAIISAHTNADFAPGGLCDLLAETLRLRDTHPLHEHDGRPAGRVGTLSRALSWSAFLLNVREAFGGGVRYGGAPPRRVRRLAVCSGSGSDLMEAAFRSGCDALVTGDVKYHGARDAESLARLRRESDGANAGFALVDAGHFETEIQFAAMTARRLKARLSGVAFHAHRPAPAFRVR
jgi:dinuclear metal center YbgI/SA1388 family protein